MNQALPVISKGFRSVDIHLLSCDDGGRGRQSEAVWTPLYFRRASDFSRQIDWLDDCATLIDCFVYFLGGRESERLKRTTRRSRLLHFASAVPRLRNLVWRSRVSGQWQEFVVFTSSRPPLWMASSDGDVRRSAVLRRRIFALRRAAGRTRRLLAARRRGQLDARP